MFRKILLISTMFLSLAACETIEQINPVELLTFGDAEPAPITEWYRAYIDLGDDMDNPASPAFQNYAQQARENFGFEAAIVAEFDQALEVVIANPRALAEQKREHLNTLSRSISLLAKHRLVSPAGIGQLYDIFDRQTATAYRAGRLPLGLHDAPSPTRKLPVAMIQQPYAAFEVTWRAVRAGDYAALDTLLDIARKVAKGGNTQIERMAITNLAEARLPVAAWRDQVMKYYPDLARARIRALQTRMVARFRFQNRALGQRTHQRLLAQMPDIHFVTNPAEAEGVLIIREVAFQTQGPKIREERRTLSRGGFDYYTKNEYPNITNAAWTEKTTEMSGRWAIHLELSKPNGTRISERTVEGQQNITAVQCSQPVYTGIGDNKPKGWPRSDTTARCENSAAPATGPEPFQDLAIDATMATIQSMIGPLRKVQPAPPRKTARP